MLMMRLVFSDLIRMKWRISIQTQVRGSESLLLSIENVAKNYFDCFVSTVISYSSKVYKLGYMDNYTYWVLANWGIWITIPIRF